MQSVDLSGLCATGCCADGCVLDDLQFLDMCFCYGRGPDWSCVVYDGSDD